MIWPFAHDLLRRYTKKRFHRDKSDCQTRLSPHNTRPNFHTERLNRAAQTILADLTPASHTIHNRVSRLLVGVEFNFTSDVAMQHFCRLKWDSQTVHLTTPWGPHWPFPHRSRTSHSSRTCSSHPRSMHGNLLLSQQPQGESSPPSMSSNPLGAEGVFLSTARTFASNRSSLFPGLPRCALQALHVLPPRLLRPTAAATTIAHPGDVRGRHQVSWPWPVQPTGPRHTPLCLIPPLHCEPPERELHRS